MSGRLAFTTLLLLALSARCFAPEPRPAITGLCFVKLTASSLEGAEEFYANYLGLKRSTECWSGESHTCFYITPYQDIEVLPVETPSPVSNVDTIGLWTEDAAKLQSYLLARGIDAGNLVVMPSGLHYFDLRDPEHHKLRFVSKKGPLTSLNEPPGQLSHHMIHTGFVVRERPAMDRFYQRFLGFHVYWRGGMKDTETDWVDMQVPDGGDWIEFMLNIPKDADKQTLGIMNHVALGVLDVRAAANELKSKGIKLPEPPEIGRDGKWQLNLYDPDGTRVELMEFTPIETPCCSPYTAPHPKP